MNWVCKRCCTHNLESKYGICFVCGCPAENVQKEKKRKKHSSIKIIFLIIIVIILVGVGALMLFPEGRTLLIDNEIVSNIKAFFAQNGSKTEQLNDEEVNGKVTESILETEVLTAESNSDYSVISVEEKESVNEPEVKGEITTEQKENDIVNIFGSPYKAVIYQTKNTGLALKAEPNLNSARYLYIPENGEIYIDKLSNGWGHTTYNGYSGWVAVMYTKIIDDYQPETPSTALFYPIPYIVVNTGNEGLELRCSNTEYSSSYGTMMEGEIFMVEAVSDVWAYGSYNGQYGWAYMGYLRAK